MHIFTNLIIQEVTADEIAAIRTEEDTDEQKRLILLVCLFAFYILMGLSNTGANYGGQRNLRIYMQLVEENEGSVDPEQAEISDRLYTEAQNTYGAGEAIEHVKMMDPIIKFHGDYSDFADDVLEYTNGPKPGEQDIDNVTGILPLQEKLEELRADGRENSFEYRRYQKQLETELRLGEPQFKNVVFWNNLLSNWNGMDITLLLLFPLAFFIASVYTQEVKTGMDHIILCSVKGRKEIVTSKIAAVVITSFSVCLVYLTGTFIGNLISTGEMAGAGESVRCLSKFRNAQFEMPIGSFVLLVCLWLLLVAIVYGLLVAVISALVKSQSAAFGISFIFLLIGMATKILGTTTQALLWPVVDFSFYGLGNCSDLFGKTKVYNVFGRPVSYAVMALIVAAVFGILMVMLHYIRQKKRMIL